MKDKMIGESSVDKQGDKNVFQDLRVLALADHFGHSFGKVHGGTTYFLKHYPAIASPPMCPIGANRTTSVLTAYKIKGQ